MIFFACIVFIPLEQDKLKSHEKVCKNKDFCGNVMPSEMGKILEFKHYLKSNKMPYIIHADIESLIRKIDGCANNPEIFNNENQWAYSLQIFSVNNMEI